MRTFLLVALATAAAGCTATEYAALQPWLTDGRASVGAGVGYSSTGNLLALTARETLPLGATLLELRPSAILTPAAAYADREFGTDLRQCAARVGPGFGSVALAALLAAERVRGFMSESWYAGSTGALSASPWSALTYALWRAEEAAPSPIEPELEPIVEQGVSLIYPIVELASRRSWSGLRPGAAPGVAFDGTPPPSFGSDEWFRAGEVDDAEGLSGTQLRQLIADAFGLVLGRQCVEPPLEDGDAEAAQRWGWADAAPSGPALLPPIAGVFCAEPRAAGAARAEPNAALRVPRRPAVGNRDEDVAVRCVATRALREGEGVRCHGLGAG